MLESGPDTELLATFADTFAKGEVPQEIVNALRMGRMTALRKPDGGVRGIVVGDFFRRLVSRTLAKQFSQQAEDATPPFQYAFKTRAGCECVAHIIQSLTELDPCTVISVDGVGAFDSRFAMLSGLLDMEGERLLPFVQMFCSQPSSHLFDDEVGEIHTIHQGEGGEQGDALMPLLFSLGQQRALRAIAGQLKDGERLFAFLDDLYVSCQPARVAEIHRVMRIELWTHSKISIHHGKTKLWNKAGILPSGTDHDVLLERIPAVPDLQAAWLLLSYCASARANFALRTVRPARLWHSSPSCSHDSRCGSGRCEITKGDHPSRARWRGFPSQVGRFGCRSRRTLVCGDGSVPWCIGGIQSTVSARDYASVCGSRLGGTVGEG